MPKICDLEGVRGYPDASDTPEIWLKDSGRYVLSVNDGLCAIEVDLFDLAAWLDGPGRRLVHDLKQGAASAGIAFDAD